jgi:serine/threonine protein phosphatase 1
MATIAIGDIHGNLAALNDLLERIEPELCAEDTVVFLGDYIDRGPDSRRCIDKILDLRSTTKADVVTLLGNHEDWLLITYRDFRSHSWILGMHGLKTVQSYCAKAERRLRSEIARLGPEIVMDDVELPYESFFNAVPAEHIDFLHNLKLYHRTAECVCVHGGLNPEGARVEEQPREDLIWGTRDFPDCYEGEDAVCYGHTANPVLDDNGWPLPRVVGRTYGIDTISRGVLTAVRLPDEVIFQSDRHMC